MNKKLLAAITIMLAICTCGVTRACATDVAFVWDYEGLPVDGFQMAECNYEFPETATVFMGGECQLTTVESGVVRAVTVPSRSGLQYVRIRAFKNGEPPSLRAYGLFSNLETYLAPARPGEPIHFRIDEEPIP